MGKCNDESEALYKKHGSYASTNEGTESPVGSAESANEFNDPENQEGRSSKGLSVLLATMFLVGEMAGAGVLNLPRAIANTGWAGVPMLGLLCAAVGYSGTRLAACWVMLEERWPEYRVPCRRPYPAIAYRALGRGGKYITEISLNITLVGAATVFLLLTTQMITALLVPLRIPLTPCEWILVLGGILVVPTWLGTPKDMWPASILAMVSTFVACLVVMIELIITRGSYPAPVFPTPTFSSFFLGFGSILFALGGASIFPTVQNDMKDRTKFSSSVIITFLVLLSLYAPLTVVSYGILGNAVTDNILLSVGGTAVTITQSFILIHFVFAFVIVINPVMQTMEGILYIPNRMCVSRCVVRTIVMAVVMLLSLAVPHFSKILDLIGGSTVTLLSFVMPPICFFKLSNATTPAGLMPYRVISLKEKILLFTIVIIGVIGGIAASWSALSEIIKPAALGGTCFSRSTFL